MAKPHGFATSSTKGIQHSKEDRLGGVGKGPAGFQKAPQNERRLDQTGYGGEREKVTFSSKAHALRMGVAVKDFIRF